MVTLQTYSGSAEATNKISAKPQSSLLVKRICPVHKKNSPNIFHLRYCDRYEAMPLLPHGWTQLNHINEVYLREQHGGCSGWSMVTPQNETHHSRRNLVQESPLCWPALIQGNLKTTLVKTVLKNFLLSFLLNTCNNNWVSSGILLQAMYIYTCCWMKT